MTEIKKKYCSECLWNGQCGEEEVCDHYSPTEETEMSDEWIEYYIEERRIEFRREWFEKMDSIND